MTGASKARRRAARRSVRSERWALATTTGTPRRRAATSRFGQISASISTMAEGRTRSSTRRATHGRSMGK